MRDYDEVVEVYTWQQEPESGTGVPAADLADEDLFRELAALHRTRHATLRHGSDAALSHHTDRLVELEADYLRRFPDREIDPERLRSGARAR
ncbi:hypothetical protein Cme02nite_52540 [Catellatospora methionotrophica]|uniref:Uncharacterized protein n=1 Tax=Catellatospora methionotrophica TaxID=121620 RepID=A0A8J3PH31_9ACTN|nr:DUF6158 family protein [Catellatospora methionotrophica]GIG16922.1 hypothetical protein Cme02nite_52540 [Catellatospora methionotrophica]